MGKRNIVVIGGSMGSLEAFKTIVGGLPADLEASVFVVWHMSPDSGGILAQLLDRIGPLHASEPYDGEQIKPGRIYVARPDHHLLVENSHIRVTRGPKENRFRPAVDPLFRSAAYAHGRHVIGVVTSGALDDGTSGLWAIKERGGITVVQDPNDAQMRSMPESAIRNVRVDHILPVSEIASVISRRSREVVETAEPAMDKNGSEQIKKEIRVAAEDDALKTAVFDLGDLTPYTCPECSGVLARLYDGDRVRFRCHTGHAFSPDSLLAALTESIEDSLWSAIRGIDESILLLNHLGDHFAEVDQRKLAARFFQKANEAKERKDRVREVVLDHESLTTEGVQQEAETFVDTPAVTSQDAAVGHSE